MNVDWIAQQTPDSGHTLTQPVVLLNCNAKNSYKYRHIFFKCWINPLRRIISPPAIFPKDEASFCSRSCRSVSTTQQSILHQRLHPRHPLSNHAWFGPDRNQHSLATKRSLPIFSKPPNISRSHYPTTVSGTLRLQRPDSLPESPRPFPWPFPDKTRSRILCDLRPRYKGLDGLWPTAGSQDWFQSQKARTSFLSTPSLLRGEDGRYLGRSLPLGGCPSGSSHNRDSGKKYFDVAFRHSRDSSKGRLGLLRSYDCRIPPRSARFLCDCRPDHQADPTILRRPFLRGDLSWPLVRRIRVQTMAVEYSPTLYRCAAPRPRKTFLATFAFQDGWIHLPCNCHQSLVETSQSLAILQPKSNGRTNHSGTSRSLYFGQNSDPRLDFQSSLFPLGPVCLQLNQLVPTPLLPGRLATTQSPDYPKPAALGTSPIASPTRTTGFKFAEQLPILEDIFGDFKKHQPTLL